MNHLLQSVLVFVSIENLVFGYSIARHESVVAVDWTVFWAENYRDFALLFLGKPPEIFKPKFTFYSRTNPELNNAERVTWTGNQEAQVLKLKHFSPHRPTKVIIHGFLDNTLFAEWMHQTKKWFLLYGDYNVILVNWGFGNQMPYGSAYSNARIMGGVIAKLIAMLCRLKYSTVDGFHIIGQSLGAHVAGIAGRYLGGQLGQITGLDPAGPGFVDGPGSVVLSPWSAQFVDVVHTSILGHREPCGDVDFYLNGGVLQPNCGFERINWLFTKNLINGLRNTIACDHTRAADFYIEALKNTTLGLFPSRLLAYQCDDYQTFKTGKCYDCGIHQERCAYFGPRAVEYKRYLIKNGKPMRFFAQMVLDENLY